MLIRLADPTLMDDLCAHFRRSGFLADRSGKSMVSVEKPDMPNGSHVEVEVQAFLEVWRVMNPGQNAVLLA